MQNKSVRFPDELYDYIMAQDGRTFTDKLLNILEEYRYGDANRKQILRDYQVQIDSKRESLCRLRKLVYMTQETAERYQALLESAEKDIERLSRHGPGQ